jgi:chemotaxis-related protein WspB
VLILVLRAGGHRYALDCSVVVEVIPRVTLQKLQAAPAGFAGVFQYRGEIVPVVDLGDRLVRAPCEGDLGSRIVLLRDPKQSGHTRHLGVMVDAVLEARRLSPEQAARGPQAVMSDAEGMLQWLGPEVVWAWSAEAA